MKFLTCEKFHAFNEHTTSAISFFYVSLYIYIYNWNLFNFRENPVEMICQRPHIMVDKEEKVRATLVDAWLIVYDGANLESIARSTIYYALLVPYCRKN